MMRRISYLSLIVLAAAALPALAAPGRYAITTAQIAEAVSSNGMQISPEQVTLFTSVVASVANPELKVQSIDRAGGQGVIARIACTESGQCLPFLVALHVKDGETYQAAPSRSTPAVSMSRPSAIAVRQGATTALFLDGMHVHISLSVICLENGAPGQMIRATSLDRNQVFMVRVAGDGTLRGRL